MCHVTWHILISELVNLVRLCSKKPTSKWLTFMTIRIFPRFGGKEEYMSFMNEFVETAIPNMDLFLSKISVSMRCVVFLLSYILTIAYYINNLFKQQLILTTYSNNLF